MSKCLPGVTVTASVACMTVIPGDMLRCTKIFLIVTH